MFNRLNALHLTIINSIYNVYINQNISFRTLLFWLYTQNYPQIPHKDMQMKTICPSRHKAKIDTAADPFGYKLYTFPD